MVFVEDFLTGSTNAHTFVDVLIDDDVKKICGGGFNFLLMMLNFCKVWRVGTWGWEPKGRYTC